MSLLKLDERLADHTGGVVVVTRFECPQAWMLIWLRWQHRRVHASAARHCPGFLRAALTTDRRSRTAYSITLWRRGEDLYDMGQVPEHIEGVRRAGRLGIRANAAVFPYLGHWSNLMFGSRLEVPSPLTVVDEPAAASRGEAPFVEADQDPARPGPRIAAEEQGPG